jgi:hypothetical protein
LIFAAICGSPSSGVRNRGELPEQDMRRREKRMMDGGREKEEDGR